MFCDINQLLSKSKEKSKRCDQGAIDKALNEIRKLIRDEDDGCKVPIVIKDAIRKAAEYRAKAATYEIIIEKWFDDLGVEEDDSFRNVYVDCVQQTNDPDEAIKQFESLIYSRVISK